MTFPVIVFTFPWTFDKRPELAPLDFLEHLGATAVASICLDFDGGFDVRYTRYDTADSDQVTELCAFNVSYSKTGGFLLVGWGCRGFNVQMTVVR